MDIEKDNLFSEKLNFLAYDEIWNPETLGKLEEMGMPVYTLNYFNIFLKRTKVSGDNSSSLGRRTLDPEELIGIDEETKYRLSFLRPYGIPLCF
jgi:hypothetical protein